MTQASNPTITLPMMRDVLYSAVVSDALDALGYPHQSPRVPLAPQTGHVKLVGRCRTTLWADMSHPDPRPYELELIAVDGCKPDDVLIAAAGGSMRSGIWGELLSTAARNSGCVGAIVIEHQCLHTAGSIVGSGRYPPPSPSPWQFAANRAGET